MEQPLCLIQWTEPSLASDLLFPCQGCARKQQWFGQGFRTASVLSKWVFGNKLTAAHVERLITDANCTSCTDRNRRIGRFACWLGAKSGDFEKEILVSVLTWFWSLHNRIGCFRCYLPSLGKISNRRQRKKNIQGHYCLSHSAEHKLICAICMGWMWWALTSQRQRDKLETVAQGMVWLWSALRALLLSALLARMWHKAINWHLSSYVLFTYK